MIKTQSLSNMENQLNNDVANDEFHGMNKVSPMEMILNNPGFVDLAENIFGNLDSEKQETCEKINQSSKQILENATLWVRKFKVLSKKNLEDWTKVIQSKKNSEKEKSIILYLKWMMKKDIADLPCYTNPNVQDDFRKKILIKSKWLAYTYDSMSEDSEEEDANWIKILAPLTDNLNVYVQGNFREKMYKTCKKRRGLTIMYTPIHLASRYGYGS